MVDSPEARYARTDDGLHIFYQTFGQGEVDIVVILTTHCLDMIWEEPSLAHVLQRLGRIGRVIMLDYRGFGGSDPVPLGALPTPETWMEDTRIVLDAVSSSTAHIICHGGSDFLGMLFAATYPERTKTLTLFEASARILVAEDYPIGLPPELIDRFIAQDEQSWGTPAHAAVWAPSRALDETFCRWSARFERGAQSPSVHSTMLRWVVGLDLREVLPTIRVPTLIMHRSKSRMIPVDQGRYLSEHIPAAKFVLVPGSDYWFFTERADEIVDQVEELITGMPPVDTPDRALATVMFTDIVSSTDHAARLGDGRWTEILDQHDRIVTRELDRFRGRKVNPTGDGVLATFDGPARAIRCAQAIRDAMRTLGVELRAGLHIGEVELRGQDIGGIAVHVGARIAALAGPGDVLVSRTVTDLVAGSGIEFEDRGDHKLKGVPGAWRLFVVQG